MGNRLGFVLVAVLFAGLGGCHPNALSPLSLDAGHVDDGVDGRASDALTVDERDSRAPIDRQQPDERLADARVPDTRAGDMRDAMPFADADFSDGPTSADRPRSPCASAFSGGYVNSDLTLTKACSPYVIDSHIQVQATLTIEAGVTVLFERGRMILVEVASGRLQILGTASAPVVLDSAADSPAPGDWAGVQIVGQATKPHTIQFATIKNCGAWQDFGCIWVTNFLTGQLLSLDHVTIDGSKEDGVDVTSPIPVPIANCAFRNIARGKYAVAVLASSFASIAQNNDFGGAPIAVQGGMIDVDTRWKNPGTDVVVTHTIYPGGLGTTIDFTIGEGMRLLFAAGSGFRLGQGESHLNVAGTSQSPVLLSSAAAAPQPGDWAGISVYAGIGLSGIRVSHATIEYAGRLDFDRPERGGILLFGQPSEAVITDSVISHSADRGIYVSCDTPAPTLTGTTLTNNQTDDIGPGPQGSAACR